MVKRLQEGDYVCPKCGKSLTFVGHDTSKQKREIFRCDEHGMVSGEQLAKAAGQRKLLD